MTDPRIHTVTTVRLTPVQMCRLQAAGWEPGEMALGEALVQAVEMVAKLRSAALAVHEDTGWCPACDGHSHAADCPALQGGG